MVHMQRKRRLLCTSTGAIHIASCLLTKREALLLSRRLQTNSARHNLLENPTIGTPTQSTSSYYKAGFPKQVALTIREPPALPQKAISHQLQPIQLHDNLNKGKQVYNPLTISQTGNWRL